MPSPTSVISAYLQVVSVAYIMRRWLCLLVRQMIMFFTLGIDLSIEQHALIDQLLHAMARIASDKLDDFFVAQADSGNQSVINV